MGKIKIYYEWIKGFFKWLFVDGWLLWLFLIVPAAVIDIMYPFIGFRYQTWHAMAYAMQLGAFIIFLVRLYSLYKHYDPCNNNIFQAICNWMRRFYKLNPNDLESKNTVESSELTYHPPADQFKDETTEERLNRLESQLIKLREDLISKFENLNKKIDKSESNLMQEIEDIYGQRQSDKRTESKLQLKHLGREVVAVLWLLSAATIFAITNLAG
jgi:hypothetical protein